MKKGRSLKQSLGLLCGLIAAACAVLYSITLVYVLETAENKLMASVMDDMLQTVVTADILQGKPPRLDQVTRSILKEIHHGRYRSFLKIILRAIQSSRMAKISTLTPKSSMGSVMS